MSSFEVTFIDKDLNMKPMTWSETYLPTNPLRTPPNLTQLQHFWNNKWFVSQLSMLKDDQFLWVEGIQKLFDKSGDLVETLGDYDMIYALPPHL